MNKHFTRLLLFLTFISCAVLGARLMDIDQIRSSDRLKLWDMPISSGTLNTLTSVGTFTNKVISGSSNTLSNIPYTSLSSMSSANLATVVSDETGSGFLVFGTSPTLTGATLTNAILNSPATTGGTITSGNFVNPTISGASISGSSITTSTLTAPTVSSGTFTSPILVTPTLGAAQASSLVLNPSGGGLSSGAILELLSTSLTFAEPAMTTTQRDNISNKPNGSQIYNTTTSKLNYWNGGSWLQVASETSPTITGGSITSATFTSPVLTDSITTTQIATPSSPAASKNKIYTKSDDKLYVLTSAGIEKSTGGLSAWATTTPYAIGDVISYNGNTYIAISAFTSGASFEADILAAGKWKLVNTPQINENLALVGNTFEDNDVGGWTAISLSSGTNGLPVTVGTAGLALSTTNGGSTKPTNMTAAAVTSSGPINGVYSLNFATTGTISAYSGYVSQAYAIPIKAQAKVMAATVSFKVVSGTFVMGGTSADSMAIAIYDPLNNAWIPNNGAFSFNQSSGVGIATTTFQTNSTTTSLQIYIYSPNSPTGSASFLIDDVHLGIQSVAYGSPVTDWQSYTPTVANVSNSAPLGKWRRVGDSMEIMVYVPVTGTATGNISVSLPTGYTIDNTKFPQSGNQRGLGTVGAYVAASTGLNNNGIVAYLTTTTVGFMKDAVSTFWGTATPSAWANADSFSAKFTVPIVGWSSSVVMSSDAVTNVVAMSATITSATHTSTANWQNLPASTWTKVFEKGGNNFDTSTGIYTVSVSGDYNINGVVSFVSNAAGIRSSRIVAGGTTYAAGGGVAAYSGDENYSSFSYKIPLTSGQTIQLQAYQNSGGNLAYGASTTRINIERISGPAQIAASESVSAYYTGTPTGTLTNAFNTTTFPTKIKDTHNAYSSGTYTIPVSGTYSIVAQAVHQSTLTSSQYALTSIYVDGSAVAEGGLRGQATTTGLFYAPTQLLSYPLLAGQLVTIRSYDDGTSPTFSSGNQYSRFSIVKTGNY